MTKRKQAPPSDPLGVQVIQFAVFFVLGFSVTIGAAVLFFTDPVTLLWCILAVPCLIVVAVIVVAVLEAADTRESGPVRRESGPVRNVQALLEDAKEVRRQCAQTFDPVERVALQTEYQHIYDALMQHGIIPPSVLPPPVTTQPPVVNTVPKTIRANASNCAGKTVTKNNSQGKVSFQCPACKSILAIPSEYIGQKGKCRTCGTTFIVNP